MNPELRLETRINSIPDKALAKEILNSTNWYKKALYDARQECKALN